MAIKKDFPLNIIKGKDSPISREMIGKKYGRLTVLDFLGVHETKGKFKIAMISAICDCGSIHNYQSRHLREGKSLSCGCLQSDLSSKLHTKHGQKSLNNFGKRGSIIYSRWRSMFDRVRSDKRYENVKIAERWKGENGFINFCQDMGEMPTKKHTVDRFPVCNGDYTPENCRWATMLEQAQNTTRNKKIMYNNELLCLSEIERRTGLSWNTIQLRVNKYGWSMDKALNYRKLNKGEKYATIKD